MIGLFDGLPVGWQIYFTVALVIVLVMMGWTTLLFVRSGRQMSASRLADADAFTWIFLVPALNEERTIADSVSRLIDLPVARRRIIVIDDGSTDDTPTILAGIDHPDLRVIRRDLPDAQRGKAAALNHAYRQLADDLPGLDRAQAIVVIVDADGRLAADAPARAAAHFADPRVGGCSHRCGSTTAGGGSPGFRTSSSASTDACSRPAATTGGRRAWAATGSSTG